MEKDCKRPPAPTPLDSIAHPSKAVHAYVLQVIVLTNHMNGKDTHIRGLRILGPEEKEPDLDGTNDPFPWATAPFKMYRQIR